jgi:hypothetical protein
MTELAAKQKWMQLGLALGITLAVSLGLLLVGAKAAALGGIAAALWAMPYIELWTTRRQPRNLALQQLRAIGVTIGFVLVELIVRS